VNFATNSRVRIPVFLLATPFLLLAACATRPLPKYEKPIARAPIQHVRTTAYSDCESDHRKYQNLSASGTPLQMGQINSAAADWSRWPQGTVFRILPNGPYYRVDDYGWELAGRNTIDLYVPTMHAIDQWGVRHVDIEILQWGDPQRSYEILKPRDKYAHVRRMLGEIRSFYD